MLLIEHNYLLIRAILVFITFYFTALLFTYMGHVQARGKQVEEMMENNWLKWKYKANMKEIEG